MRNEKLRRVFESLGFARVRTVISSGNVLFDARAVSDISKLELKIEMALTEQLGIRSAVIIRTKEELDAMIRKMPFGNAVHGKKSYLIVTFLRAKPREIFNTVDASDSSTPDFMRQIEKKYGKEVTTRTWNTVGKMAELLRADE